MKPVQEITLKLMEYRLQRKEREKDPFVYYVTDLVRCSMKRELEINIPEIRILNLLKFNSAFIGELVHIGMEKLLKDLYGDEVQIETENLDASKDIYIDKKKYTVKGRIDAIMNGSTGIEIKLVLANTELPYEHHIDQARIYNWLYGLKRTILLYIQPTRLVEFEVVDSASDDEILHRIREFQAPRYTWECKYCEYKHLCPYYKL